MELLRVGFQVFGYLIVGVLVSKLTIGIQNQLKKQNNEPELSDESRLDIAGLIIPFWPLAVVAFVLYVVLALGLLILNLVMKIFSFIARPFI